MLTKAQQIESAALQLPLEERARLAERLIASLDEAGEIEQAWTEEAERRYARYRSGVSHAEPAEEVISAMRERLR